MRRTSLLVALLALVGTALVAPPAQAALDPGFEQPAVGTCYRMSEKELRQASYGEAAVDCAGKHTSQVVAVTYLPDGLSWRRASVGKLTKLFTLDLQENQIENVAPLAPLNNLQLLILWKNKIADLAPLVTAIEADAKGPMRVAPFLRLYLAGNPLGDAAKNQQIPALKKLGVKVFLGEPGEKP